MLDLKTNVWYIFYGDSVKIEKMKKTGSKYKIILDNGRTITTYEDVILNNGLLYHKYISDKLLEKINSDTNYYAIYNKVLGMINRRLRSEYEIEEYLVKNEISLNDIEQIIQNLKRIGLLDDKLFASAYTNDKINFSNDGPYKIRKNLELKKVKEEYINEAIESVDKNIIYDRIDKIIDKKIKYNTKYTPFILRQKLLIYLINLGYGREDILYRLENTEFDKIDTSKQIEKIYNQLAHKYEGKDLIFKLKNKLYLKGYSKEDIDNFIIKNSS